MKAKARTKNRTNGRYHGNGKQHDFTKRLHRDITKHLNLITKWQFIVDAIPAPLERLSYELIPHNLIKKNPRKFLKNLRFFYRLLLKANKNNVLSLDNKVIEDFRKAVRAMKYTKDFLDLREPHERSDCSWKRYRLRQRAALQKRYEKIYRERLAASRANSEDKGTGGEGEGGGIKGETGKNEAASEAGNEAAKGRNEVQCQQDEIRSDTD